VLVSLLAEGPAIGSATEGDEQLAVRPPDDRRERVVEAGLVVEDGVADLVELLICCGGGGSRDRKDGEDEGGRESGVEPSQEFHEARCGVLGVAERRPGGPVSLRPEPIRAMKPPAAVNTSLVMAGGRVSK